MLSKYQPNDLHLHITFKWILITFRFFMWGLEEYVSQIEGYWNLFYTVFWVPTMTTFFIMFLKSFFQPGMDDWRKNASTKYISIVLIWIEAFISLALVSLCLIALILYVFYLIFQRNFAILKVKEDEKIVPKEFKSETVNKSTFRMRQETESRIEV